MKKPLKTALVIIAIVCIIAAAVLIYSRPMTISEICADIDITKSAKLQGSYSVYPVGLTEFEFGKDDAQFGPVMELLSGQKFRRSVRSLFPQGTRSYRLTDGVFKWDILCEMREPVQVNGENVSGTVVRVSYYYGELEIECVGTLWRCRTRDQAAFAQEVLAALKGGEGAP